MKTLHLSIIVSLCIGVAVALGIFAGDAIRASNVFQSEPIEKTIRNPNTVYWNEGGMKHTYVVGQKIDFTIELHGYGSSCPRPDYAIKNQDGVIVWHSHPYVGLCNPQIGEFDKKIQFADYNPPLINETGLYWLMGTYENQTGRSPVLVTLKPWEISDTSPLDICNQVPNLCHVETLEVDNQTSQYVEVPLLEDQVVPIKLGGVTLYANGAQDTQIDGIDCSKFSPKEINITFGHHSPYVTYDGYFVVNGTKHFAAILPNGTTSILKVCWPASNMKPLINISEDTGSGGTPIYRGYQMEWFDENKTIGIMLHDYSQSGNDYYNKYLVKLDNKELAGFAAKTYNLKQVHYYDSSNLNPKVSLYDYSYEGIDKDGLVSIYNQTFYQTTLDNDIYKLKGSSMQFHNVTFSFPDGTLITPGGAFVNLDVKFQDGFEEIYGGIMSSPDGSGTMVGGIQIPTQYGPHLAVNSVTVLGNHTMPQAGLTIYHDKIKLLVSTNQMLTENNDTANRITKVVPPCVSKIPHQYAIAGPRGDSLCPVMNFGASEKILNATGFYGIYNYASYPGTLNYVLEPGHNGTIEFLISVNMVHNFGNITYSNHINITNDAVFMHDAGMNNHPGVDVLVEPKSEMIGDNGSALVTMTFSASKDALPGIYWVTLPPGFCTGGQMIILTVTDCEK